jgi:hypothetical protein
MASINKKPKGTALAVATSTAPVPFQEDWDGCDWSDVQRAFHMEEARPDEVLLARYSQDGYDGRAHVLYRNGGSYFHVYGSHCSCFGLEDQWDPEEYDLVTLVAALERSSGDSYGFCGAEGQALLPSLRIRLRRRLARDRKQARLLAAA